MRCSKCGKTGHNKRTCKKKAKTTKKRTVKRRVAGPARKCGKCGKTGHNARTCKKRAAIKVTKTRATKRRAAKKVPVKRASRSRPKVTARRAKKKPNIPSKWSSKWNSVYEYALQLGRRYGHARPSGYGSRNKYRRIHIAIDPYSDYVYVRAVDEGPGARGQSIWGYDILTQQSFPGRMTTLDAMAIGKAVHEKTGALVDVDSSKRNSPGETDHGRAIFGRDAPDPWVRRRHNPRRRNHSNLAGCPSCGCNC